MKYALCIGINYVGTSNQLSGCINDAVDWQVALQGRGFHVTPLLEGQATLTGIKLAMTDIVARAKYRDTVVITYSGHGTYGWDSSGDEEDGRDEAICPVDCWDSGMLYDDEIREILESRRFGVRVVFISDSCHSGTVNRLVMARRLGEPRFVHPSYLAVRSKPASRSVLVARGGVLLAGCSDTEYSYDSWFSGKANGAFTHFALSTLDSASSYRDWMARIRSFLPTQDYPQTPQLEASYYRSRWSVL